MNFFKHTLTALLAIFLFVGCNKKTNETLSNNPTENSTPIVKKEVDSVNLQTINFTIKGMTCAIGCAKTIQEELNGLYGVQDATVDFDKELATVSFDKTVLTIENISKLVEATGDGKSYSVVDIK